MVSQSWSNHESEICRDAPPPVQQSDRAERGKCSIQEARGRGIVHTCFIITAVVKRRITLTACFEKGHKKRKKDPAEAHNRFVKRTTVEGFTDIKKCS